MHALVVVANPDPRSLTHAVARRIAAGVAEGGPANSSEIADLSTEGFDPRFTANDLAVHLELARPTRDVLAEQARIDRADALVLVYPVYWWSMPGLLKGWIDRVFTRGWAYDYGREAGVVKKLGVDYETLKKINPKLIYASISGFGQTGPWADRPGFDLMAQAMSGVMSVTGHPGMPPVKAGVPVADIGCALFCTYAILSAYIGRQKSGEGQYIDASLFEAALAFSIWDTSEYWGTGVEPTPVGTSNKMSAPYQAVKSKDGYFVMGATNQKLWTQLCEQIGRTELLEDPRFATNPDRLKHRPVLIEELEKTFVTKTSDEWVEELLAVGIPAGKMSSYPEAFASEHGQHRKMRIEIPHPIEGTVPNIGFPVKLMGTPQQIRMHPPLLGEHTDAVLKEVGLDADAIEDLKARGAFGK